MTALSSSDQTLYQMYDTNNVSPGFILRHLPRNVLKAGIWNLVVNRFT